MSTPKTTLDPGILETIRRALEEDIGAGDATSDSIIPPEAQMTGQVIAKQEGVIAGLEVARACYGLFDPQVSFQAQVADGDPVEEHHGASAGTGVQQVVALVSGPARSLLTVERTALNFMGRMSGIATLTRRYVDAVAGTQAVILDTRKTAPGLRLVDKLAVRLGGGRNHRVGLSRQFTNLADGALQHGWRVDPAIRQRAFRDEVWIADLAQQHGRLSCIAGVA